MAKKNMRGATRPLHVRLAESKDRTALLEKRVTIGELKKEARQIRARLFRRT